MEINISTNIATYRHKLGWSQELLAEKMNVSRQTISKWENGTCEPDICKLLELSGLFGISVDELITGSMRHNLYSTYFESDELRIIAASGYNISSILEDVVSNAELETVLYDDYPGIIYYETVFNYGIGLSDDDSTLKDLIHSMGKEFSKLYRKQTVCIVTKKNPSLMHDFITWLSTNADRFNIDCVYLIYELNSNYDYNSHAVCMLENESYNERWDFIYRKIIEQKYSGPFPPAKMYQAIVKAGLGSEIPAWFMDGI